MMLAEKFIATRTKLLRCYDAVTALADETGLEISAQWQGDGLRAIVDRPFMFTVCGEINAGKSSLINALTGLYLCRVNALPETDRPTLHAFGEQRRVIEQEGNVRLCEWPHTILRCVQWRDMPGLDAVDKAQQQAWLPLLQESDAVLVVLPFRNPWAAPTWDFLSRMPVELLAKTALVLQQCDEAQGTDLRVMQEHVRDLAMKRLGSVPKVFAVSARLGFEAKTKLGAAALLQSSGLPALEQWLEARIQQCPERQEALQSLRRAALGILFEMDETLDQISRKLQADVRFLDGIEREIFAIQQTTLQRQMQGLGAIGEVFSQESHAMSRLLRKRLGVFRSMGRVIGGDDSALRLESLLQERLTAAVRTAAARDMVERIAACEVHWQSVMECVAAQMRSSCVAWSEMEIRLQESRGHFVQRMGDATMLSVGQLRVRLVLDHALRERTTSLAVWMAACFFMCTIAGVTGALGTPWVPQVASGVTFLLGMMLWIFSIRSAREIVRDYRDRLLLSGDVFFAALRGDYEEGLRLFFREYAQGLESVKQSVFRHESAVQPLLQRWNERFLEIKTIEQEMAE